MKQHMVSHLEEERSKQNSDFGPITCSKHKSSRFGGIHQSILGKDVVNSVHEEVHWQNVFFGRNLVAHAPATPGRVGLQQADACMRV